jgi:hypothetical protein
MRKGLLKCFDDVDSRTFWDFKLTKTSLDFLESTFGARSKMVKLKYFLELLIDNTFVIFGDQGSSTVCLYSSG